ncbi:hypothetical protein ACGFNU_11295 [Spirillospora sp. NPDC048911]|uniref:hypothetical protein n=1 Tax=Spirillospora sp. NPDC048911 TaxID=3364527 RepID=UPI00371ED8A5
MTTTSPASLAEAAVHAAGLASPSQSAQVTALAAAPQQQAAPEVAPGPGAIAGGTALAVLVIAFYLYNLVKHKKHKVPPLIAAFVLGVLLAGSAAGLLASQFAGTAGQTAASLMTSVTGGGSGGSGSASGGGSRSGSGTGANGGSDGTWQYPR